MRCPNPAVSHVHVPLASTFVISSKKNKQGYVEAAIESDLYRFVVKDGAPNNRNIEKLIGAVGSVAKDIAALSTVVLAQDKKIEMGTGCAKINRFGIENESFLRRRSSQSLRPLPEVRGR